MANRERGEVAIEVKGVTYIGRPAFESCCQAESVVGMGFDGVLEQVKNGWMSGVRNVVWILLNESHGKEIRTLKDASDWIERAGGLAIVLPWVNDVLQLNADMAEAGANGNGRPPTAQADAGGTGEKLSSVLVSSV